MPFRYSISDALRNVLTSPLRIDQAIYELAEAVTGREKFSTVLRVLFHPETAKPEDLRTTAERFFPNAKGWTAFLIDSGLSPSVWLTLGASRGGSTLGVYRRRGPTPIAKRFVEDFGPLSRELNTFGRTLRDTIPIAERASILKSIRAASLIKEFNMRMEDMVLRARKAGMDPTDPVNQEIMWAHMVYGVSPPGMTKAHYEFANAYRQIFADVYDWIGSAEAIIGTKKGEVRIRPASPMGYIQGYIPLLLNRRGTLNMSERAIAKSILNHPVFKQLKEMGRFSGVDADQIARDVWAGENLLDLFERPETARLFNPFRLKRRSDPKAVPHGAFVGDLFKIWDTYVYKAANTYALTVPLDPWEAALLHGDPTLFHRGHPIAAELSKFNRTFREAPVERRAALRALIEEHYKRVAEEFPQQRSILTQLLDAAVNGIPGYSPFLRGASARMRLKTPQARIRAQAFRQYLAAMKGTYDPEKYATVASMQHMLKWVTDAMESTGLSRHPIGRRLSRWIAEHTDTSSVLEMQRSLVKWTYMTTLGLRPVAVLTQLTQTPTMTLPTIGLGNVLAGIREGVPKLARSWVDAARLKFRGGFPWHMALVTSLRAHMPEFLDMGLMTDFRQMELGANIIQNRGVNAFLEATMVPWKFSEMTNRAIAFYGARNAFRTALRMDPSAFGPNILRLPFEEREKMINFAALGVVHETQIVPAPAQMTPLHLRLSPIGKQFSTFPLGFRSWLLDAAVRSAVEEPARAASRVIANATGQYRKSWLPYARYLVTMSGMANFSRDVLGIDLGERIAGGVINLPFGDQPFEPLPLPPIPGAIVSSAWAMLSGDIKKMSPTELPVIGKVPIPKVFFPAGLAVSRAARVLNQTRDGFLTDDTGRGLFNFDRKYRILYALGFFPVESARDALKTQQILATSDRIKDYRWRLASALSRGDLAEASSIRDEYSREFNGAPPLVVHPKDIRRVIEMQRTTKLRRTLETLGGTTRVALGEEDPVGLRQFGFPDDVVIPEMGAGIMAGAVPMGANYGGAP